jgi:hypothetical protein
LLLVSNGSPQTLESTWINNSQPPQTFFLDTEAATAGQTYQLWVQHDGSGYGSETMEIGSVPQDINHIVTVGGTAYKFSTSVGQNAYITFTISSTETIVVSWTSGTYATSPGCMMTVTGPSPSTNQVGIGDCTGSTGTLTMNNLITRYVHDFRKPNRTRDRRNDSKRRPIGIDERRK